ncbi:LAMI_0H08306g1_1 [Lachancea mirantina]|uniref:LAMI_0H08306g1_1 n=1 Tax=Lachancea mirantina TaxID=1230905 RepID=A0A1G4KG97_9SACH|nr:LAMI_0H08306g1_1 [Lachancea mirantina]
MSHGRDVLQDIIGSDEVASLLAERTAEEGSFSEENESVLHVDGDEFRLDDKQTDRESNEPFELHGDAKPKNLFVADDSLELSSRSPQPARNVTEGISKKRRVQFGQGTFALSEDERQENPHPWDFQALVSSEFRQKLPSDQEVRNWKRPSRTMLRAVTDVLENNVVEAVEAVFEKYQDESDKILGPRASRRMVTSKEKLLSDIINKIYQKLRKSKFPSRVSDRELDIEYIFAKRKFIQERYSQELSHAEVIEQQLARDKRELQELQDKYKQLLANRSESLVRMSDDTNGGLHPAMAKAMVNSFGLITDAATNQTRYEKDVRELNLSITETKEVSTGFKNGHEADLLRKYLPSIFEFKNPHRKTSKISPEKTEFRELKRPSDTEDEAEPNVT